MVVLNTLAISNATKLFSFWILIMNAHIDMFRVVSYKKGTYRSLASSRGISPYLGTSYTKVMANGRWKMTVNVTSSLLTETDMSLLRLHIQPVHMPQPRCVRL